MKGIKYCGECVYYSMKKHKCTLGATDEGVPTEKFYADCPLSEVVEVVRCKDCKYWWKENQLCTHDKCCHGIVAVVECSADHFCAYGERIKK